MDIDILGIDLAKRVFQLHGADRRGRALHSSKVLDASHRWPCERWSSPQSSPGQCRRLHSRQ
jgi:hypothetical protein